MMKKQQGECGAHSTPMVGRCIAIPTTGQYQYHILLSIK